MSGPVTASTLAQPRFLRRIADGRSWWHRVDLSLTGSAAGIAFAGILMIYSATKHGSGVGAYSSSAIRQLIWIGLGFPVMFGCAAVDYRRLRAWSGVGYALILVLLLAVLTPLGSSSKGAQAWFALAGFQVQPSEFAKLAIIVCAAAFGARQHRGFRGRHVFVLVTMTLIPVGLIVLQPDLGTGLVFIAIVGAVLFAGGASLRVLGLLGVLLVVTSIAAVEFGVLKQYQLDRLGAFLDPTSNMQQSAYNLNQSKIAIGSGGIVGKGLFLGTQTNLRFVPEQRTDFIFTVIGEDLGLLGSGTLLALFVVLLWRIWRAAVEAPDRFGMLVCVGVLAMIVFQLFENVGMTMGIMPITGIPLPLVSYGGSATLVCFVGLGLVLSVRLRSDT